LPTAGSAPPRTLSAAAARRIALAAQGFADPRPAGRVDARHIRRVLRRVGLLQLDSINVLCRSHYLPVFSRCGPYPRATLDRMAGHDTTADGARELFEYWAHEASLLPLELHPLLRWRMAHADDEAWGGIVRHAREAPEAVEAAYAAVADRGPLRARDAGGARSERSPGEMWNWHEGKISLEYLFWAGRVTAAQRVNFERHYDLPERVLAPEVLAAPTPSEADAQRELTRIAARALGVATEPDLGDYFRLPRAASKARVADLVDAGELHPVQVEGWGAEAYLWSEARRPRAIRARALLSPFDSLVWFRPRVERLFDFRYRLEVYTPRSKRIYGYYVLPFLLDEALVARVDLKADRREGVLRVAGAFGEEGIDRDRVATELQAELASLAGWLGLDGVTVQHNGDLAAALAAAVVP
jgi:uncharacterized protein YcaQ